MVKLTENAYRDLNIGFANELSLICERLDIDVWELIALANRHPRVNVLQPGPGVGGHCVAVDPWFIVDSAPEESRLIRTAREVNDAKPLHVETRIRAAAGRVENPKIACLGLAFKADIGDLRESPALAIVERLAAGGDLDLFVAEPHIDALPPPLAGRPKVRLVDAAEAVKSADVVALLVNHRTFQSIPREYLAGKMLVDTRGMFR